MGLPGVISPYLYPLLGAHLVRASVQNIILPRWGLSQRFLQPSNRTKRTTAKDDPHPAQAVYGVHIHSMEAKHINESMYTSINNYIHTYPIPSMYGLFT